MSFLCPMMMLVALIHHASTEDVMKRRRSTPRAHVRHRLTAFAVCAAAGAAIWSTTAIPSVVLALTSR